MLASGRVRACRGAHLALSAGAGGEVVQRAPFTALAGRAQLRLGLGIGLGLGFGSTHLPLPLRLPLTLTLALTLTLT